MAITTPNMRQVLALAYGAEAAYASLHTANPGTTGASEVSGGSYARQALSWTWNSGTGVLESGQVTFSVPADTTITNVGVFDAATAGNFGDSIATNTVFVTVGIYKITLTFTQS